MPEYLKRRSGMAATEASAGTLEFLRGYYEAIDAGRAEEALARFAAEATVRAGNGAERPWMEGLREMARELRGVVGTRHEIAAVVEGAGGEVAYEVEIAYQLGGGREVSLAGAVFCAIRDGCFQHQHLYVDLAPLREALAAEGG